MLFRLGFVKFCNYLFVVRGVGRGGIMNLLGKLLIVSNFRNFLCTSHFDACFQANRDRRYFGAEYLE